MLAFVVKHSLIGMFLCALLGFLLPAASNWLFPVLPYILFTLMLLTLLGMPMQSLMRRVMHRSMWCYGLLHSGFFMGLFTVIGLAFDVSDELLLAILGVGATGSLFATPAIVRALGFDSLEAMAMTIVSTLLLPIALFIPIKWIHLSDGGLDFVTYGIRLLIFIAGPILFSYLAHRYLPQEWLKRTLVKISPYTILLVFAFPFGLIGSYRGLWDQQASLALWYLLLSVVLVAAFFLITFLCYRRAGVEEALTAAITAGNRNVLLTYSIAGGLLGPAFLPLAGALQVPTYVLPVVTKRLHRLLAKKK